MPTIGALNVYPIKACRGSSLQAAALTKQGLLFDREWVVVKADTGKFLTQRQIPRLALVEPSLPVEATLGNFAALPADAALTVTAPGQPPLRVPLLRSVSRDQLKKVTVWEWTGGALDEGEEAAAWFSTYLGTPCRLIRYAGVGSALNLEDDTTVVASPDALLTSRATDAAYANGYNTRFSDGYPMLLATEASLADLNTKLPEPLPMNRFRPNLVIRGTAPWAEDTWRNVSFAPAAGIESDGAEPLLMTACKPCDRCKVTTINQATADAGDEPLDTLGEVRSGKGLGWSAANKKWTHSVFFGWNMVTKSSGVLHVGDEMTVIQPQLPMAELTPA